jgi:uncharacterized membrane protein
MAKVQEYIEVQAPVSACYELWMNIDRFPEFMPHVRSVTRQGNNRWHWTVDGPMGSSVEWDALVDARAKDNVISWHSISNPTVGNQGAVRFDELSPEMTRITATIQYEPPAGILGETVAQLFSNPSQMVKDSLFKFKNVLESDITAKLPV